MYQTKIILILVINNYNLKIIKTKKNKTKCKRKNIS